MLDLTSAAPQIAAVARRMSRLHGELPARRAAALTQFRALAGGPVPEIRGRPRAWVALPTEEPVDLAVPPAALPPTWTVLAVDGSQIEPDYHDLAGCALLNVGWAVFRFGAAPQVEMHSQPTVQLAHELPDPSDPGDDDGVVLGAEARRIEVSRMLAEVAQLQWLIEAEPAGGPTVALADGPLVAYWVLNLLEQDEATRRLAHAAYLALFAAARERGVALAGYISRSRSAEVTHLLRYTACEAVRSGGELCELCRRHFPRVGVGEAPCYAGLEGVLDRHLFLETLGLGQRSACFAAGSRGFADELGDAGHALRFFTLRVGDDLARVEVPEWVCEDPARLALLHAALVEQAALGHGYPVALCEAHEQAVVRGPDRSAFYELLARSCAREGLYVDVSPKLRSKRQPVG